MAFWVVFAFLLGLVIGGAATWWLFGQPPFPTPRAAVSPVAEPTAAVPDSMSLSAQRLLNDLERKYEGTVAGDDEGSGKPKRSRAKRVARPAPKGPSDHA